MKRRLVVLFILILLLFFCVQPIAAGNLNATADYLQKNTSAADYGGMLDWSILALAGVDKDVSALIAKREKQVRANELFLPSKSTDFHRTIIGAVAAKKDPRNFAGYDLIGDVKNSQLPNGKFADTISRSGSYLINAHIWGIISLYAAGEIIPNSDKALEWLINNQNVDGGFSIDTRVKSSDIDMTAMALIALASLGQDKNHPAVEKALQYIKKQQGEHGDFVGWGGSSSETLAQVIQALIMLDIDPAGPQWTEREGNLITALFSYRNKDGSFSHSKGGRSSIIATYQSLSALADYYRGESIFRKLRAKNIRFLDLTDNHFAADSIKNLAARGVINGYLDGTFRPDESVKRQEFAKMIVKALPNNEQYIVRTIRFIDVPAGHWASPYINTAVNKGLIRGKNNQVFAPEDSITGAEVMTILVRAMGSENNIKTFAGESWYAGYVREAEKAGLLYPNFDPEKKATRAQCAYSLQLIK